jgi:hypothetical protein
MDIQKSQGRNNGRVAAVLAGHSFNREAEIKPIERGPPSTWMLPQSSWSLVPRLPGAGAKLQALATFPCPSSMLAIRFDYQPASTTRTTTKDENALRTGDGQSVIARIVPVLPANLQGLQRDYAFFSNRQKQCQVPSPACVQLFSAQSRSRSSRLIRDRQNASRFGKSKPLGKRMHFQDLA